MRYLLIIFVFLFTAVAYGNEVVSTLLSKAAEKAEQKAELAVNDMFNNVEIDLSGFYKGKPSYGISTILPLYKKIISIIFFKVIYRRKRILKC